jgi:Na+-transporting methylmalonyl-CoA/oxaloacetate decarboxylase gamma subunit
VLAFVKLPKPPDDRVEMLMEEEMKFRNREMNLSMWQGIRVVFAALFITIFGLAGISHAAAAQQKTFPSAEEAVKAAVAAARSDSDKELLAIFGPGAKELIFSGDAVADRQRRARFLKAYDEKNRLVQQGNDMVLVVGNDDWPFPIPVMKKGDSWVFDLDRGKEEILNRRIGQNELDVIQVSLAYVDAQREYAMKDREGGGLRSYAQKFRSDSGKKNGLYWEAKAGEEQSPLGPLAARARSEGYGQNKASDKPVPYRGYYYKILTAQGKDASGGAYSYLVKGKMIGGFALVAYPAEYGNSGVMSFIVNHEGKVFQKDLGKNTASAAAAMKEYNPDKTWAEVKP